MVHPLLISFLSDQATQFFFFGQISEKYRLEKV